MTDPKIVKTGIRDVVFGNETLVVEPVNLYSCKIGSNCLIGPFVEIQCGVVIGNRTRIQSHSFICEGVTIGANCFIGHGVMFINDKWSTGKPANGDRSIWKPTNISNNVYIGSNATILPISVCEDVVIGAGSVVTKDITTPGVYAGNPAILIKGR